MEIPLSGMDFSGYMQSFDRMQNEQAEKNFPPWKSLIYASRLIAQGEATEWQPNLPTLETASIEELETVLEVFQQELKARREFGRTKFFNNRRLSLETRRQMAWTRFNKLNAENPGSVEDDITNENMRLGLTLAKPNDPSDEEASEEQASYDIREALIGFNTYTCALDAEASAERISIAIKDKKGGNHDFDDSDLDNLFPDES